MSYYTADPVLDAARWESDQERLSDIADAAERDKRQRLERMFYRALSSETELPGPCKTWELIAEHPNIIKPILFWAARHKDEHPALRSLLSDLCDVWLDQQP